MALDKWIAVIFMVISVVYTYAAFTYPLLPFERNMVFLPNTMPMVLGCLGVLLALIILFAPKPKDEEEASLGEMNISNMGEYKVGQALFLIGAMILYALALRPIGFLGGTVLFLVGSGWILGERKLHFMTPIAVVASVGIWYLVQETLGIFLRPLPWFIG